MASGCSISPGGLLSILEFQNLFLLGANRLDLTFAGSCNATITMSPRLRARQRLGRGTSPCYQARKSNMFQNRQVSFHCNQFLGHFNSAIEVLAADHRALHPGVVYHSMPACAREPNFSKLNPTSRVAQWQMQCTLAHKVRGVLGKSDGTARI